MHIYFSGIGGTAIGPLAMIAKQAGYEVSGSDKQDSQYIQYLKSHGINNIHIGQEFDQIAAAHSQKPIDWYVYSSAVSIENPDAPELKFCHEQAIHTSKRDELLNKILKDKKLKLIAIAGTHGKTTTTAMVIWLFKQLGLPISYSVGAKIPFGDMGHYEEESEWFVYEADEFDRNFLAFYPEISLITGLGWDHHEIFPTLDSYKGAFEKFVDQTDVLFIWKRDADFIGDLKAKKDITIILNEDDPRLNDLKLPGKFNREDALLAIASFNDKPSEQKKLIEIMNQFPGLQRRMEEIVPGLYSDYAHTPEKIRGAMSVALELFEKQSERTDLSQNIDYTPVSKKQTNIVRGPTSHNRGVVVVYEPLTNRRQHFMIDDYKDCFEGAKKVYWIPSYLAREDPSQRIIPPEELISRLSDPSIAEAKERDNQLKQAIQQHLEQGDMVVAMAGGGGDSLDEWIRGRFA